MQRFYQICIGDFHCFELVTFTENDKCSLKLFRKFNLPCPQETWRAKRRK